MLTQGFTMLPHFILPIRDELHYDGETGTWYV